MPGKYNFTIYQGATFGFGISWKTNLGEPKDLTGYSAECRSGMAIIMAKLLLI